MTKLYLITGFLGAGKTTFVRNMIALHAGCRIKVIVNEFGREGIDGSILRESGADIEEIINGSVFCSCRLDQFERTLEKVSADNPDVILVEASGLSDPTGMKRIIGQPHLRNISYAGNICLVDPTTIEKVLTTVRVSVNQLKAADIFLLNKADLVSKDALRGAKDLIQSYQPGASIISTRYGRISRELLAGIGQRTGFHAVPMYHVKDVGLSKKLIVLRGNMSYSQLEDFIGMFMEDTYRIKGFVELEGSLSLVDCVGNQWSVQLYQGSAEHKNHLVVLAGSGMRMKESVNKAAERYSGYIEAVL